MRPLPCLVPVLVLVLNLWLLPGTTRAETLTLEPPATEIAIRFHALGLFPLDGNFTRFRGQLTYDRAQGVTCQVTLQTEVASLAMSSEGIRERVTGPEYMDAARYPTLSYQGDCLPAADGGLPGGLTVHGMLTMHGVTHAFDMTVERTPTQFTAQGTLHRADWGMTSGRFVGGSTARITVSIQRPVH